MNFLSNKAHVYTTSKTCEALAMQPNVRVILLSSDDSLHSLEAQEDFFRKHDIKYRFVIVSLRSFSNKLKKSRWRIVNWLETIAVNFSILKYMISHHDFEVLYYRDTSLLLPILWSKYVLRKPIFMEIHAVLHKKHGQFLNNISARISNGVIAISEGLKDYYQKINPHIMVAFCAAAEPERFEKILETKEELRNLLQLPLDKKILMYSGNLFQTGNYDSYGIEDIIHALPFLDTSIIFVGVGKKGQETKSHELLVKSLSLQDRVYFLPWVEKQKVYAYWKAADILILPAAGAQIGNSPTKMFEYLAAGKPIVSAGTPPIFEVLKDRYNALMVSDYKDPQVWARVIKESLADTHLVQDIVRQALLDAKKYTWKVRGSAILSFIS